jgi:outer membrane protein assembly factor BamB
MKPARHFPLLILALALFCARSMPAADWPQWNGPNRDGHSGETGLLKTWPEGGPKLLWTFKDGGSGFSAPAVVGGKIYLLGSRKGDEYVIALDAEGKELWATKIAPPFDFEGNEWTLGPNSTPAFDGGLLFALGSQGVVVCVDAATGAERWRKDLPRELAGEVNPITGGKGGWGFHWSPLVDGDNLIVTPGGPKGLVAALNKKTGALLWQSAEAPNQCTYASPIVVEVGGVRQYVVPKQSGAVGVDAKTGKVLWEYETGKKWPDIAAVTPLFHDGEVFLTAWLGGCDLVKIQHSGEGFSATQVYAKNTLGTAHGGVVLSDGHLYASHDLRAWRCLNFQTGEQQWEDLKTIGVGSITVADGRMVVLSQNSNQVSLVEMNPTGMKVAGAFKLPAISKLRRPSAKAWTHPVVADGKLFVREQEMLFCYQIK